MTTTIASLPGLIRDGTLDAELGALLWSLARAGVPVHVVAPDAGAAERVAGALRTVARDEGTVSVGVADALERVLALPVPLRPATGAVVVVREGIVAAAHLLRPPLRDAGGHVKPQGPAVLATADAGGWEHFAWGIGPELAGLVGLPAGDFSIDADRRRDYLAGLAEAGIVDAADVDAALRGYAFDGGPRGGPA